MVIAPASPVDLGTGSFLSHGTGRHALTQTIPPSNAATSLKSQSPALASRLAQDGTPIPLRLTRCRYQSVCGWVITLQFSLTLSLSGMIYVVLLLIEGRMAKINSVHPGIYWLLSWSPFLDTQKPCQNTYSNDGSVSCASYCFGLNGQPWNGELPVSWNGAACVYSAESGVGCRKKAGRPVTCTCARTGSGWNPLPIPAMPDQPGWLLLVPPSLINSTYKQGKQASPCTSSY